MIPSPNEAAAVKQINEGINFVLAKAVKMYGDQLEEGVLCGIILGQLILMLSTTMVCSSRTSGDLLDVIDGVCQKLRSYTCDMYEAKNASTILQDCD
jgi:tetrahydromethanopterin S-methyltransferase subunit G